MKAKKTKNIKNKKSTNILSNFQTRKFKIGSVATAITIVVMAAVVVINLIVNQLTDKFDLNIDLTQNKFFSLTQQSVDFLNKLSKDVEIIVLKDESEFRSKDDYHEQAYSVLKKYEATSKKIKLTYVDTTKNPTYLNSYSNENITESSIIVKCGDKHKIISENSLFEIQSDYYGGSTTIGSNAEQELTSALLYVTSDNQVKLSVLSSSGEQDASGFTEVLKKNNYNVIKTSLLTEDIPDDVKLVIINAPSKDYDSNAIEKLENFMKPGDKSVVYFLNAEQAAAPNLNAFLEKYKVKVKDGIVYETNAKYLVSKNIFTAINSYVDVDYKNTLKNPNIPVLMPNCKPIEVLDKENVKTLLQFSNTSGILPLDADKSFDIKGHICGPIPSAVVAKVKADSDKTSNLAVIGSYLAVDQRSLSINAINNSAYFTNMVNTLTKREDVGITIEAKSFDKEELGINFEAMCIIGIAVVALLPLAILIAGLVVFLKRRNK